MIRRKSFLHHKARLLLGVFSLCAALLSCAGPNVEAQKSPGSDLWMYHTYSWRPQSPDTATHQAAEQQVRDRTDQQLSERGMIRVPPTGNPDFWIDERVAPRAIQLEFMDAHTGKSFWKGQSNLPPKESPPSQEMVNSSVDLLVNRYIAAQNWMPASFWWKGIDLVGSY